ncbi:MAG: methyltransferase domain-containing protein [Chloroflexota bacterium]|nr:methyltransferase domain-containing protein [Chloroflexota bacterium]
MSAAKASAEALTRLGQLDVPACHILRSRKEVDGANELAAAIGLAPNPVPSKSWDNLLAVRVIEQLGTPVGAAVADLGCRSGILLTWLDQRGYRNLYGCDLRRPFPPLRAALRLGLWRTLSAGVVTYLRHRSRLRTAPVEDTGLPPGLFSVVTSMSVVEHGVDLRAFFAEAARLLRPGGLLVVSTDYWPLPIDVGSLRRFSVSGGRDRVFDRAGVEELCGIARDAGFVAPENPDLDADEPVVTSAGFAYTFLLLTLLRLDETRA